MWTSKKVWIKTQGMTLTFFLVYMYSIASVWGPDLHNPTWEVPLQGLDSLGKRNSKWELWSFSYA